MAMQITQTYTKKQMDDHRKLYEQTKIKGEKPAITAHRRSLTGLDSNQIGQRLNSKVKKDFISKNKQAYARIAKNA